MKACLATVMTYAVLGFWALVSLFPLVWILVTSVKGENEIMNGPYYLPFGDFTPSLKAWSYILFESNDHLLLRFVNSAVIGLTATLLVTVLGAMAVYGVTRFRMNQGILFAMLASRVLPPVVIALPLYMMAYHTGTLDSRFALIITYTAVNLPVAVWLLRPVLGTRASEQEEAALLDGASHMTIFFSILLPMVASGIAAAGFLVFILCWNEYLFAAYLTATNANTLPQFLAGQLSMKEAQVGGDPEEWAQLSAAIVLMAAPLLVGTAAAQRILGRMATWR